MFFKIYFSRKKFERDAAALVQKQNGWAAGAYCGARILSASPDEQYISPMEAKKKIWQANSDSAINKVMRELDGREEQEELWDIKYIKDGETIELVDTYAYAEACRKELAYCRSKPGIGVRYFMEKRQ